MAKKKKKKQVVATIGLDGKVTKHNKKNNYGRTTGSGDSEKTIVATIGLDGKITKHNNNNKKAEPITSSKKRTYFNKGLFEDGYDFGDITKTLLGSGADMKEDFARGLGKIGEGFIDTTATGLAGLAKKSGNDNLYDKTIKFIERDLDNELRFGDRVMGKLFSAIPGADVANQMFNTVNAGVNKGKHELVSLLGDKSDSLVQSTGQLAGTAGLQAAGVPWWLTTGVTGFGSGTEEALQNDATYGEAVGYGAISGASEIMFEKLGGIKFAGKALDTGLKKALSQKITNKALQTLTKFGLDAGAEGTEEVLTEITQNIGKKLTYEDEKTWSELLTSEEAMDGYLEAFIGGAVIGGGFNVGKTVNSIKTGRDYDTGLTANEQNVVNREISQRATEKQKEAAVAARVDAIIEEREKTFGTLKDSEKKNIRDGVLKELDEGMLDYSTTAISREEQREIEKQVEEDLKSGNIGVDSIESVISAEKTNRIKALQQEMETADDARKAAIEEEIKQLEVARAKELLGRIEKDSYLQESYRQEMLKSKEFSREVTDKDSDITKELVESAKAARMNDTKKMRDLFEYTNKIANDTKTKYAFVNTEQLKQLGHHEEGKTINGLVRVSEDGNVRVLINVDSAKALNTIIGHETTHLLEGTNEHKALQQIVKEYATTKGEYDSRWKQVTKLYEGTNANLENEITADLVGDYLFTDEQFINNLSTKEPNVFKRIYEYIKHAYKMATAGSAEARQLEQVKRKFDKAYKQISKTTTQVTKDNSLTEADSNTEYSLNSSFKSEVDSWYNDNEQFEKSGGFFKVGKTSDALKSIGVKDQNIVWDKAKIKKILNDHEEMTIDEIKEVPNIIENPIIVMQSKTRLNSITLFGEVYADGMPVLAAMQLSPTGKSGRVLNMSKISSAYGRSEAQDLINTSEILYVDPNKKRTDSWLRALELQLPSGLTTYGSIGKVAYYDDIVNKQKGNDSNTALFEAFNKAEAKKRAQEDKLSLSGDQDKTLSKEQEEYFKDSVVRDENGNLKVMYHGTSAGGHTVFDPYGKAKYGLFGVGSYFTDNKSVAESYTEKGKGNNKQIYETYLNITNPIDMDAAADPEAWSKALPDANFPAEGTNEDFYRAMEEYFEDQEYSKWEASEAALEVMESMGYDGITHVGGGRFNKKDETRHQVYIAFQPEQIKNVDNTNPTTDPDIRFSFSGENAANANNELLVRAKDMATEGVDSESIRKETGWHKGYDGKWRFEIDDSQMEVFTSGDAALRQSSPGYMRFQELYGKFSDGSITDAEWEELGQLTKIWQSEYNRRYTRVLEGSAKLKDVIEHDILFENYPQLKDIPFKVEDLSEGVNGVYSPSSNSIIIDKSLFQDSYRSAKRNNTIIHEIQHAIQQIEKFAAGSNAEYFKGERQPFLDNIALYENDKKKLEEKIGLRDFMHSSIAEVRDKKKNIEQHWEDLKEFKEQTADGRKLIELEGTLSELYKNMNDYFNNMSSEELYWNTAGEIEARDAGERLKLTADERKNIAPVSRIENVEKDNVIFSERYSLSDQESNIASTGNYNVYGKDVLLPVVKNEPAEKIAPVAREPENILPTRETINMGNPLTREDLPYVEQQGAEAFNNITEDMLPVEADEPIYEEDEPAADPVNPLEADGRDIEEVGNRKIKAYMYENPEVKPFFQAEAAYMLNDLKNSVKGQKHYNDQVYYDSSGEQGWYGTKRQTSEEIAYLLDNFKYTYADIEKGLNAIMEDHGAENNAISKRIEFMIDERLREGYEDMMYGDSVPPNEEYLNLLREKQITEYSDEAFNEWARSLMDVEPPAESITEEPVNIPDVTGNILPIRDDIPISQGVQQEVKEDGTTGDVPEDIPTKTRGELRKALLADGTDFFQRTLDNAKNRAMALLNNTDTIRVQELVFGREAGKRINDAIFQKAIDNEARSIYWQNKQRADIKALGIKPKSKMSAAVQKYGEGEYINEFGDLTPYGEIDLMTEFPNEKSQEKIKEAARIIKLKYERYIDQANEVLTKLGFDPIPKRKDYMRHFQELNDAFSRFGIPFNAQSMEEHVLPTDINGLTEFWSPQKSFFANTQPRKGLRTEYDAITGIDGYLSGIANLIFHTEDIQRGRAFEEMIRERFGQENADEVLENTPEEERPALLEKIQDNHLSNYAAWVHEWTNNIAGKKNKIDRSVESMFGRRAFSFLDTTRKQVGANMIGFNIASSLTNLIAPVQAISKTNKIAVAKGTLDTFKNIVKKDGFVDQNAFLTSRFGTDMLSKTPWQKIQDAGYVFMKGVDHFSSNLIVRSKYNELISKGMSEKEAHAEAGKFAARIMGDRTKGANAALYNSKLIGLVTQFQLEVNNQLYSMLYDTAHESKEKAQGNTLKMAAGMTFTLGQLFAFTHLFGQAFEGVAGYNPTFDVVGIIQTLFGIGGDDEEDKPFSERAEAATLQLLKSLPYTSTFTGGRIPIGQAFPAKQLVTGKDEYGNDKSRPDTLKETLPYYVLPAGYSQIKKTTKGLGMFDDDLPVAGSYTDSGNLRFPVEDTLPNKAQAAVFGQWANKNAQDYIDNERAPLKEKQIEEYKELKLPIADYWKIREGLKDKKTTGEKVDYIADLKLPVAKKNILVNNAVNRKEEIDMEDYDDFGSFAEFDFAMKNPEKYAMSQVVGGYKKYTKYSDTLYNIKANKDENGESVRNSRKLKVVNYINGLEIPDVEKYILFKSEYNSDDTYNREILDYLYGRDDITQEQRGYILKQLGFEVSGDTVYW